MVRLYTAGGVRPRSLEEITKQKNGGRGGAMIGNAQKMVPGTALQTGQQYCINFLLFFLRFLAFWRFDVFWTKKSLRRFFIAGIVSRS